MEAPKKQGRERERREEKGYGEENVWREERGRKKGEGNKWRKGVVETG